ncbi:hypothetical protein EL22_26970 [Halostagnicola sp. A56]|nr:hypothetical protein EL22_26970 [Halostagnicola sp. A56]
MLLSSHRSRRTRDGSIRGVCSRNRPEKPRFSRWQKLSVWRPAADSTVRRGRIVYAATLRTLFLVIRPFPAGVCDIVTAFCEELIEHVVGTTG